MRFLRIALLLASAAAALATAAEARRPAGPTVLFDNGNPDACDVTNVASFVLPNAAVVSRIDVWFHFGEREQTTSYVLTRRGALVSRGELLRADCDPIQVQWCNASAAPPLRLRPGRYELRTDRASVCQNPRSRGQGFVRVLGYWIPRD